MIQRCSVCGIIYGHQAPFLDTTETRGICNDCHTLFQERIQKGIGKHRLTGKEEPWTQKVRSIRYQH